MTLRKIVLLALVSGCLVVVGCDDSSSGRVPMGDIDVQSTVKSGDNFIIRYRIPETDRNWHCVGANMKRTGDEVRLEFVEARDGNDGTRVDLLAENSGSEGIYQVSFPWMEFPDFKLIINGEIQGEYELGFPEKSDG